MAPTRQQIEAAKQKIRAEQHTRQVAEFRGRYATVTGEDQELTDLVHKLDRYRFADTEGPHIGVNGHILLQQRDAMAARIAEERGELTEVMEPPREWVPVMATHERAGRLRLVTDGQSWMVRIRGVEYGCGKVRRNIERLSDGYAPRRDVVEAAARHALTAPGGPQEPFGSLSFVGGPDGEPIEVVVDAPAEEREEFGALRAKIAKWRTK